MNGPEQASHSNLTDRSVVSDLLQRRPLPTADPGWGKLTRATSLEGRQGMECVKGVFLAGEGSGALSQHAIGGGARGIFRCLAGTNPIANRALWASRGGGGRIGSDP